MLHPMQTDSGFESRHKQWRLEQAQEVSLVASRGSYGIKPQATSRDRILPEVSLLSVISLWSIVDIGSLVED